MQMVVKLGSIYPEHQRLIEQAGYTFKEGRGLEIPVMVSLKTSQRGVRRRIAAVWGKRDGHLYSLTHGDKVEQGDLIYPERNSSTRYKVLSVHKQTHIVPYTSVSVIVATSNSTREFVLDKTREYVVIRKADIAPDNAKAINF